MNKLQPHEYANLFPVMGGEAFEELKRDIRENGLLEPISIYDEKILDGRNRYRACVETGTEPRYKQVNSNTDPLKYVISKNLQRRHLNESQRAVVAGKLETMKHGGNRNDQDANLHLDRAAAASMLNVSPRTVASVKAIEKAAPELIAKIESGEMTVHEAEKTAKKDKADKVRKNASKKAEKLSLSELVSGLYLGDMREVGKSIADNSVDTIITDPPYPGEFIECWSWLSELASRVLKPSGFLFAYSGQLHLPEVYQRLSEHLVYYWTMNLLHSGNNQLIMPRNVFCGWKPILIYQKTPFKRLDDKFEDVIKGSGREKESHEWQQAETELDTIIEKFTLAGQTILDPFMGGGTTIAACLKNKRRAIGIEIDENSYLIARKRVSDVK